MKQMLGSVKDLVKPRGTTAEKKEPARAVASRHPKHLSEQRQAHVPALAQTRGPAQTTSWR